MKARKTTLFAVLLTLLAGTTVSATEHPGLTAGEQRVLRGIIKLPHEREQAVMQKLGVVSTEGFLNCLCRKAGYGSSSTSQFWHPGTIGKYDPRYSCNRPGDPCVVSGFGCSRHPAPSDLATYEACAQAHPGEDGKNLLDQVLSSIRPQSDKRADDYRRELAACRERSRLEQELRYLGGDRKAGYDYLKKKKVPLLKPPEHLRKRLNADAERIRVERVKAARRAQAKLREAFQNALPQQFDALIRDKMGSMDTYQRLGNAGLALAKAGYEEAKLARLKAERELHDALTLPRIRRDESTWNADVRRLNADLSKAKEREKARGGQAARLDKAMKVLSALEKAGKMGNISRSTAQGIIAGDSGKVLDALVSSGKLISEQFKNQLDEIGDLDALRRKLAAEGVSDAEFDKLAAGLKSGDMLGPLAEGLNVLVKSADNASQIWATMKAIEKGLDDIAYVDTDGGYTDAQKNLLKSFTVLSELTRKGAEFLPPGASDMMQFYADAMKLPAIFDQKIRDAVDSADVMAEFRGSQLHTPAWERLEADMNGAASLDRDDYLFREAKLKAYRIYSIGDRSYGGPTPYVLIPEAEGVPYYLDEANYKALSEMAYYYQMAFGRRLTDADVAEYLRSLGPKGRINVDDIRRKAEKAQTEAAEDADIAAMFGKKTLKAREVSLTQMRDDALEASGLAATAEAMGIDIHAFGDEDVWRAFNAAMYKHLPSNCTLSASTQKALFNRWRVRGQRADVEQYLDEYGTALKQVENIDTAQGSRK
jgi:hypothetical protein